MLEINRLYMTSSKSSSSCDHKFDSKNNIHIQNTKLESKQSGDKAGGYMMYKMEVAVLSKQGKCRYTGERRVGLSWTSPIDLIRSNEIVLGAASYSYLEI